MFDRNAKLSVVELWSRDRPLKSLSYAKYALYSAYGQKKNSYVSYIQNPFLEFREYRLSCLLINFVSFYQQRMDLGECPKVHDLALRADFDAASKSKDYYYDIEVSTYKIYSKLRAIYNVQ